MPLLLSLQGCMAAGKTTAARYVERTLPDVHVSYEDPAPMLAEIRRRGLTKDTPEGFAGIQRLFIEADVKRWEENRRHRCALLDPGPEEIEFYTLFYPRSMGYGWDPEALLRDELRALRQCRSQGVLFLDAGIGTLRRNKESDPARRRGSFEHYASRLLDDKRAWFKARTQPRTDFLKVDGLTAEAVGALAAEWVRGRAGEYDADR